MKVIENREYNAKKYALALDLQPDDYESRYLLTTQLDCLLNRSHELDEQTFKRFADNGMSLHKGKYIVAIFTADKKSCEQEEQGSVYARKSRYENLEQIVNDGLLSRAIAYTAMIDGVLVSLVCHNERTESQSLTAILSECAKNIIEDSERLYGITVKIIVSGIVSGREKISGAYEQAKQIQQYHEFWPEVAKEITFADDRIAGKCISILQHLLDSSERFCALVAADKREAAINEALSLLGVIRQTPPLTRLRVIGELHSYFDLIFNKFVRQNLMYKSNLSDYKTNSEFTAQNMTELEAEVVSVAEFFCDSVRRHGKRGTIGRISAVKKYIHENIADSELTVSGLAERFSLSQPLLSAQFKKYTGETICEYISRLRVDIACEYLADSTRTLSDVCKMTGFGSVTSMHRAFKRHLNVSPGVYQK